MTQICIVYSKDRMPGERSLRKLTGVLTFIVCVPLIGTIFIKPVREPVKQEEEDASVLDESFQIAVQEEIGTFYYQPEMLTGLLMYRVIPEDTIFSSSEDYIVREDAAYDPEQEYLKALAIVCRSNIAAAWEEEQCPKLLAYECMAFEADEFYKILQTLPEDTRRIKLNEIERAADATRGVVITRDGMVMAAPFFTTSPSDMLVSEVGNGEGFSLNYAYELAVSGMDFYAILKYFYGDIKVSIYE